jgi:hypothetical protein
MQGSRDRIRRILGGHTPDRIAMYDMLRNDAVLSHFAGGPITFENATRTVLEAHCAAIDATRPRIRLPQSERTETLPDGRTIVHQRWTDWRAHRRYDSTADYVAAKERLMHDRWDWSADDQRELDDWIGSQTAFQDRMGEGCFLFWSSPGSTGLMELFEEIGLEEFSYVLHDAPDIVLRQLEFLTAKTVQRIEHMQAGTPVEGIFLGEDIAFKTNIMFPLEWMRRHWLPHLRRIIEAWHARRAKVIFHSDGNLNAIVGDLVEAGIDILNPIEIAAGMDVADLHRRFPRLILAGGIDVSGVLPLGTPQQVRDATRKAIEDAEGNIMVGSSTELHDAVPLANFLAMRDAVLGYRL